MDEVLRQRSESGGEINGGVLAGEEKHRRGLGGAAWRGEDAPAKEGSGARRSREVGGNPNQRRGRSVGGNPLRRRWSRAPAGREVEERWEGPFWNL